MIPRVLVVAGSDSGGGAGIQADIKTAMALGGYACTAVTALTAQDTHGVHGVHPVPPAFIRQQIVLALRDPGADAVKTGMLGDAAAIAAVADELEGAGLPLVVDPVMVAKGGAILLDRAALGTLWERLVPNAAVITPNLPEAEMLAAMDIPDLAAMHRALAVLLRLGARAVLLKGGHGGGETVTDLLGTPSGTTTIEHSRQRTRHTHGTGCTLATAVAVGLASGMTLAAAVDRACGYVQAALAAAPGLGSGHGPLQHNITSPTSLDTAR